MLSMLSETATWPSIADWKGKNSALVTVDESLGIIYTIKYITVKVKVTSYCLLLLYSNIGVLIKKDDQNTGKIQDTLRTIKLPSKYKEGWWRYKTPVYIIF